MHQLQQSLQEPKPLWQAAPNRRQGACWCGCRPPWCCPSLSSTHPPNTGCTGWERCTPPMLFCCHPVPAEAPITGVEGRVPETLWHFCCHTMHRSTFLPGGHHAPTQSTSIHQLLVVSRWNLLLKVWAKGALTCASPPKLSQPFQAQLELPKPSPAPQGKRAGTMTLERPASNLSLAMLPHPSLSTMRWKLSTVPQSSSKQTRDVLPPAQMSPCGSDHADVEFRDLCGDKVDWGPMLLQRPCSGLFILPAKASVLGSVSDPTKLYKSWMYAHRSQRTCAQRSWRVWGEHPKTSAERSLRCRVQSSGAAQSLQGVSVPCQAQQVAQRPQTRVW